LGPEAQVAVSDQDPADSAHDLGYDPGGPEVDPNEPNGLVVVTMDLVDRGPTMS